MHLDDIEATFEGVGKIADNGKVLTEAVKVIKRKIDWTVSAFGASSADQAWTDTFVAFAGQESLDYSMAVYLVLKDTKAKLDALG